MALTKKQRAHLREKWGGKCAYCGSDLGDKWHADHVDPVRREHEWVSGEGIRATGSMTNPLNDCIGNMNPACPPCNIDKHSMSLDVWRRLMQDSNNVLMRDSATFRRAVRYGLIELKSDPIVFYFEKVQKGLIDGTNT